MDPVFIALLAKYGIEAIVSIISSWKTSGEPTDEQIKQAYITQKPEEYFPPKEA